MLHYGYAMDIHIYIYTLSIHRTIIHGNLLSSMVPWQPGEEEDRDTLREARPSPIDDGEWIR